MYEEMNEDPSLPPTLGVSVFVNFLATYVKLDVRIPFFYIYAYYFVKFHT